MDLFHEVRKLDIESGLVRDGEPASAAGLYYLSTYMTPAHRSRAIDEIRTRVESGSCQRCVVVSTQLIEAGVDIDFPVVYRELAGVDSLLQAAGRCNRAGKVSHPVPVYVFETTDHDGSRYKSTAWLERMKELTRTVVSSSKKSARTEKIVREFFCERYGLGANLDAKNVFSRLANCSDANALRSLPFASCARDYRIIEDSTVPVFVPYGEDAEKLYRKIACSESVPYPLAPAMQRHSIGLREVEISALRERGVIRDIGPFHILVPSDGSNIIYGPETGYSPGEGEEMVSLIQ